VLVSRIVVLIIFVLGVLNSLKQASGHTSHFVRKFGLIGSIYLLSWPLTVIIVEFTCSAEHHRNIITFIE
jgi:hypothetical protein